jgi:hypothetical protein
MKKKQSNILLIIFSILMVVLIYGKALPIVIIRSVLLAASCSMGYLTLGRMDTTKYEKFLRVNKRLNKLASI